MNGFIVSPIPELVTCTGQTTHWPNWASTLFYRGMPSLLDERCGRGLIFQQDKDLKLTSKLCQVYLYSQGEQGVLTCMAFPSQSSYVNSIERLWEQF